MAPSNLSSTIMSIHVTSNAPIHIPIIRSIYKVSFSLPNKIAMSEDYIRSSVGFHPIDTLKRQFSNLYTNNVTMDATPLNALLDAGGLETMGKKDRNTQPVSRPLHFGDIFHIEKDDFDLDPFNAQGGLGKMWQLFGDQTEEIINELNEALAA